MSEDKKAIAELSAVSGPDATHLIAHYAYLASSDAASAVATELRNRGFKVEIRLGADGVNWLVLARHFMIPSETAMASSRRLMETLLQEFRGEYDGWEAEVRGAGSTSIGAH
jgi:hypothetical protein